LPMYRTFPGISEHPHTYTGELSNTTDQHIKDKLIVQYNYYLINPFLKDSSIHPPKQRLIHFSNHPPVNSLIPTFIHQTFFNLLTIHNRYTEQNHLIYHSYYVWPNVESDLWLLPLCHFDYFVCYEEWWVQL
jgi:hypothetical protein